MSIRSVDAGVTKTGLEIPYDLPFDHIVWLHGPNREPDDLARLLVRLAVLDICGEWTLAAEAMFLEGTLLVIEQASEESAAGLVRELVARGAAAVVVLMADDNPREAVELMKAGAAEVLFKPLSFNDFLGRVGKLSAAGRSLGWRTTLARLTPRERQVLGLVRRGWTSKEIAANLGLSARTVEVHRSRILLKTGARNVVDLLAQVHGSE